MNIPEIIASVLNILAGIGLFLIACSSLDADLKTLGGDKLRTILSKSTKTKLSGVSIGAATTTVIQSSSAVTILVIGFIDAELMTLAQAAPIIFGANIGTTVTGLFVAFGLTGSATISVSLVFAALTCLGAFISSFARAPRTKRIGAMISAFGMLFISLNIISGATSGFAELPEIRHFLSLYRNPLLLVFSGMLLTAIVQSSSVMTSVTLACLVSGLLSLEQGIFIVMGTNIGTCITALLASLTSTKNAKRAALIHFIFNVFGVGIFLMIAAVLKFCGLAFVDIFGNLSSTAPQIFLAVFNVVFNVVTALILLPLTNMLIKLTIKLIPNTPRKARSPSAKKYHTKQKRL